MSSTVKPACCRSYNKEPYLSSLRAFAANRCCRVLVGMVSSNKMIELLETKTKSGLLSVVARELGRNSTRGADTGKVTWKVSIKFEAIW